MEQHRRNDSIKQLTTYWHKFRKKWLSGLRKARPLSPEVSRKEAARLKCTEKCVPSCLSALLSEPYRREEETRRNWQETREGGRGPSWAWLGRACSQQIQVVWTGHRHTPLHSGQQQGRAPDHTHTSLSYWWKSSLRYRPLHLGS